MEYSGRSSRHCVTDWWARHGVSTSMGYRGGDDDWKGTLFVRGTSRLASGRDSMVFGPRSRGLSFLGNGIMYIIHVNA